ncbi:zinc metallopeptidase [Candidatus Reidiella endopervernicosa]|uniref:zinc metallopeptidase n=1 Tax=Candidatus Reidiella endopervernicosa TaxID=2738883 RepID=UPI002A4E1AF2|nr:zinc metallopeptidase [Candidatus Reidiella endopervernicosa]
MNWHAICSTATNCSDVGVEETDKGDHYDPISRTVRLSKDNFSGRSLTAVAIAAHEVGHAIQHGSGYRLLMLRNRLVTIAAGAEQVGAAAIFIAPIIAAVTRTPASGGLILIFAISGLAVSTLVHLITLPVELDDSFKKALPILQAGEYLNPEDLPAARQILRAAAFTYVAGSLMGLINFWRWLAILRRRI